MNFVGSTITKENKSESLKYIESVLRESEYILVKTKDPVKETFNSSNYVLLHKMLSSSYIDDILINYDVLRVVPIPLDKSSVVIYKKKQEVPSEVLSEFINELNSNLVFEQ